MSCSELPTQPRTPRSVSDRGRYPEEAVHEELQREDTPSDDDEETEDASFAFGAPGGSEPINIQKSRTPAGSINGDDRMSISESPSFGTPSMDVDMVGDLLCSRHFIIVHVKKQPLGSPSMSSMSSTPINHWRYTPPPTTSAVRSNKRKCECCLDPCRHRC